MLTANYEYSCSNRENFTASNSNAIIWKTKNIFSFFESTLSFEHFEKKNEPHSSSISEVIDSERRAYLNAGKVLFLKILWQ